MAAAASSQATLPIGAAARRRAVRARASRDDFVVGGLAALLVVWLTATIALPLGVLLVKSVQNAKGEFVGLANYARYFATPSLVASLWNSLWVSALATAIVIPLAFAYAYCLQRTSIRAKPLFLSAALLPIFAPSLLPAISFIYIFGNQGFLKSWLMGGEIYGPIGIV